MIGTATAIALARYRFRLRGFYNGFLMLPMMMPDIVLGIGLLIFFVTIGMNLSMLTIIIGHCTFLTSYVFIIVQARMAGLDPALEEASADLGASRMGDAAQGAAAATGARHHGRRAPGLCHLDG